jgi:hypothetical protein
MPNLTTKFNILNREASIIAELLTSGLENLRKVSKGQAYYYQSFYSVSVGIERLLKLILHVEDPTINLKQYSHRLSDLLTATGIEIPSNSTEESLLNFLDGFANGNRYAVLDYLSDQNLSQLTNEPIVKFYNEILEKILSIHPLRRLLIPSQVINNFTSVLHTREDLTEIDNFGDLVVHGQFVEHSSKYAVMYFGRLMQPLIEKLSTFDGPPDNPYFNEHFRFLRQPDNYFLSRRTFRS